MTITGKNLIAGNWTGETTDGFTAFDAHSHEALNATFADATEFEVNKAINCAHDAFASYSQLSPEKRAHFLRTIGEQINALGDELVETACTETGLPAMRIQGERARTVGQLGFIHPPFFDPKTDWQTGSISRYTFGAEIYPLNIMEIKLQARFNQLYQDNSTTPDPEYLIQTHFWF